MEGPWAEAGVTSGNHRHGHICVLTSKSELRKGLGPFSLSCTCAFDLAGFNCVWSPRLTVDEEKLQVRDNDLLCASLVMDTPVRGRI